MKDFDKGRLKTLLGVFFLALALPTGALIWQAYSQLKWEAFHQYRGLADDLTNRIDAQLIDLIRTADSRAFADYSFLNVTGDTRYNFVQRSPLAAYPVAAGLPGVMGYFQVDTSGAFSTPLLPPAGTNAEQLGMGASEYEDRRQLAQRIQSVLADNRLVRTHPEDSLRRGLVATIQEAKASPEKAKENDRLAGLGSRSRDYARAPPADAPAPQVALVSGTMPESSGGFLDEISVDKNAVDDFEIEQAAAGADSVYSQQVFDLLNQPRATARSNVSPATALAPGEGIEAASFKNERLKSIGKVSDLKLDADLQRKSETMEFAEEEQRQDQGDADMPGRAKRREQSALPEAAAPANSQPIVNVSGAAALRISTFESEIDPLEFSQLDSGHFVLFRNVWREGERYVQGLLVDRELFIAGVIENMFDGSSLSSMSNLIVGYQDNVIGVYSGSNNPGYSSGAGAMQGALLYSGRLSAPLDSLELVFSVSRLPQGPGATVLGWVTLVLAMVFVGGFIAMYRLGLSQINLARQQQDFVSAVSHELKTPLTSIRMYGEMLKEGWADEAKRQDYYEFIHDESERLTRMISNVLQLAKITRNEPNFDLQPISVGELMSNIESKISGQVERAGFALEVTRDEAAAAAGLNIDEDCFAQIIINLVDNAIKFSKNAESKAIQVGARLTGDKRIQFSVRDYGPGILKNQMKKIFKLFYRTESELTRETVGTGIGLAIVHQLAVAMNGQVDVLNRNPGAEFIV